MIVTGNGWTMHRGNCLDVMAVLDKVDHVITDPPYEAEAHTKQRRSLKDATQRKGAANTGEVRRVDALLPFPAITPEDRLHASLLVAGLAHRWVIAFCQIEPSLTRSDGSAGTAAASTRCGPSRWTTTLAAEARRSIRRSGPSIFPGSMGAKSFIVRGKGNADSFHSCSHGAGRSMSRTQARKSFTLDDHAAATAGVECRKDEGVLDETPAAYKSIDDVMAAQADLVEVVHTLKQVLCVKG